ncbi:MAG: hypothetical protein ACXVCY_13490 [Pseudobdellovibrionaceae bacterium]
MKFLIICFITMANFTAQATASIRTNEEIIAERKKIQAEFTHSSDANSLEVPTSYLGGKDPKSGLIKIKNPKTLINKLIQIDQHPECTKDKNGNYEDDCEGFYLVKKKFQTYRHDYQRESGRLYIMKFMGGGDADWPKGQNSLVIVSNDSVNYYLVPVRGRFMDFDVDIPNIGKNVLYIYTRDLVSGGGNKNIYGLVFEQIYDNSKEEWTDKTQIVNFVSLSDLL